MARERGMYDVKKVEFPSQLVGEIEGWIINRSDRIYVYVSVVIYVSLINLGYIL